MLLPHNKVSGGVQDSQIMIPSFFDRFYVMPPLTNGVHYNDWNLFIAGKRKEELDRIIEEESLNPEETQKFMENAFRDGYVQTNGTAITKVLPPVSRFTKTGDRTKKRTTVLEKLTAFFERFWNIAEVMTEKSEDFPDDNRIETSNAENEKTKKQRENTK